MDDALRRAAELDRVAGDKEAVARWLMEAEEVRGLPGVAAAVGRDLRPEVFSGGSADRMLDECRRWNEIFTRIDGECQELAGALLREAAAHRQEAAVLRLPPAPPAG